MAALIRELTAALERDTVERFCFPPTAYARIERALERAAVGADAAAEFHAAIQLVIALDRALQSPGAARTLRERIRAVPAARQIVRKLAPRQQDAERRFRAALGQGARTLAPRIDSVSPPGALSATRVIDPTGIDRARAQVRRPSVHKGGPQGVKR